MINDFIKFFKELKIVKDNKNYYNSKKSYIIMRYLYLFSGGYLIDLINKIIFKTEFSQQTHLNLGFKFYKKYNISNEFSKEILNFNCHEPKSEERYKIDYFDNKNIPLVEIDKLDLFKNSNISKLILDKDIYLEAQKIIGSKPVFCDLKAWWSMYSEDESKKNQAAQYWHRDIDRLRDIKIFFYLTDVNNEGDGCFEFVENSHTSSLKNISFSDNRLDHNFISKKFSDKITKFFGNAGQSFIVDTRGIHRGGPLNKNKKRCILQLYLSNSNFGYGDKLSYSQNKITISKSWSSYEMWKGVINSNLANFNNLNFE